MVRHGRWYLLCLARHADPALAYRIDRVDGVELLNVDIEPPPDLNPVAWLEAHLGTEWRYATHVEFAPPFDAVAPHITRQWESSNRSITESAARCAASATRARPAISALHENYRSSSRLATTVVIVGRRRGRAPLRPMLDDSRRALGP